MRRTHVQSLSVRGGAEVTLEDSRPPDDAVWGIHLELGVRPCRSAAATSRMRQPSLTERLSAVTSSDAGVRFRELHMMMLCLGISEGSKPRNAVTSCMLRGRRSVPAALHNSVSPLLAVAPGFLVQDSA